METFQKLIHQLSAFWQEQGCIIHQGYDLEKGAGTLNPATFLKCLGPEPYNTAYVEPSRRPTDGRYAENPNRLQHYFQYQVILKPSPPDIQTVYLESLKAIGLDLSKHDIRFVHDDWENPTIGAAGLGWEVWIDGMEVTQITYFQILGGLPVKPVAGELTYGLERLAIYLQNKDNVYDIRWDDHYTYGDIYKRNEIEWSTYNFEYSNAVMWHRHFEDFEQEAKKLIELKLPIPAYDFVMKCSHSFNMLDARGAISVSERTGYITRIRNMARAIATCYIESREALGFPLLHKKTALAVEKRVESSDFSKLAKIEQEDFLLEIGSEELPATFVEGGLKSVESLLKALLDKADIQHGEIKLFGTPRRLAIQIHQLQTVKPAKTSERKGPPLQQLFSEKGVLTSTGEGFLKSLNEPPLTLDELKAGKNQRLKIVNVKNVDYLFATVTERATSTAELLVKELPDLIQKIQFPKKMTWANYSISYARPIVWIVALFGDTVLPFTLASIESGRVSYGHRQLAPGKITLHHPRDYLSAMRKGEVIVDPEEREREILAELQKIESELGGMALEKEKVLHEVLYLLEKPHLTYAKFDPDYLKAPKELLISEMVKHQKYFPVGNDRGELMNYFVISSNNIASDEIRKGNCKVLSARLKDGLFLYNQDLKQSLEHLNEKLRKITFQKDLGTVWDKVERLQENVKTVHRYLPIAALNDALRAAELCKADLASAVVFEFPDLQGTMGREYALAQGETKEVALAIAEHWMPLGEHAPLPETSAGITLSLAEKFDNLLGCFAIDLKPSSSSDPYALRRQVMGIIKMVIRGQLSLPLRAVLSECFDHLRVKANKQTVIDEVLTFITHRIKTVFQDYDFSPDIIEASLSKSVDDIYDTYCRVRALHHFRREGEQFDQLFEVYKRAKGQLDKSSSATFSDKLLKEPAELALYEQLNKIQEPLQKSLDEKRYDESYRLVATLQPLLAKLFDQVKILDDNPELQSNRLGLLKRVLDRFELLLDFTKIKAKA